MAVCRIELQGRCGQLPVGRRPKCGGRCRGLKIRTVDLLLFLLALLPNISDGQAPPARGAACKGCGTDLLQQRGGQARTLENVLLELNKTGSLRLRTQLNLGGQGLSGEIPPWLATEAPLLEILDLSANALMGHIPPELASLAKLWWLDLSRNSLSGPLPAALASLPNLAALRLQRNSLSGEIPAELGDLGKLQMLSLANNRLSGAVPPQLGSLASLASLDLSTNLLSGELPPELGGLRRLQQLDLSHNRLAGSPPPELVGLLKLRKLQLDDNRLAGSVPSWLGNLTKLSILSLSRNSFSGGLPSELGGLRSLLKLDLSRNRLAGPLPPQLGSLAELLILFLSGNSFGGELPPELSALQRLKMLDLANNRLSGRLPPWLGSLAQLASLSLANNSMSGELPPELGRLRMLQQLYLSHNRLSGRAPPWLGNLTQLRGLSLHANSLSGELPPQLGGLRRLQLLFLHDNHFSGRLPPSLGNLAELTSLSLSDNSLSGELPPQLGGLRRLHSLFLSNNSLVGPLPAQLGQLAELAHLIASGNLLSGRIPPELGGLGKLVMLDLSHNRLSGPLPPQLGNLSRLQIVHLLDNRLSGDIPPELSGLRGLQRLDLSSNRFAGRVPAWLGGLTGLTTLTLGGNSFSGELPPELGSLRRLWGLDLSVNGLVGRLPPQLANLTELTHLWLAKNSFTGEIPPALGGLRKLRKLDLSENSLGSKIPPELGRLRELQILDLSFNRLSGILPSWLGNLTELTTLYLNRNSLTGEIPPEMSGLRGLQRLYLSANRLSGPVPPWLGNLTELSDLDLSANALSGEIPLELGSLRRLQSFKIGLNRLSGTVHPDMFTQLTDLHRVWLQGNARLTGDFPTTQPAAALREIRADGCGFTGSSALGPAVTTVDFRSNRLTALPPAWHAHASLKVLLLAGNGIAGWPLRGVLPRRAFFGPNSAGVRCQTEVAQPPFVLPELQELEVSGNPLGPDVDARDFLYSLSYLPKLKVLRARGCRLQGEPQAVNGQMRWWDGKDCNGTQRPGFASLQEWDMAENSLHAVRASPPAMLQVANLSFNALGSSSVAPGAAALHEDWWRLGAGSMLRWLDARGNPALGADVLPPESGNCAGTVNRLAADPWAFRPNVAARGRGLQHVECTKPCQMGLNLLVDPLSLNASGLCRCAAGTAGADLACTPCPVGTHAESQSPFRMRSACRACPAGSSTLAGGRSSPCDCKCAAGSYMANATPCTVGGPVDSDGMRCLPCGDLLTTRGPGATGIDACVCDRARVLNLMEFGTRACGCAEGFYLNLGRTACERCPPGRSAARGVALEGAQGCRVTPIFFLFVLCSVIAGTGALFALPVALGALPLHLRDVSLEEGHLVAQTSIGHGLLRWRPVQVIFEGTGHPDLDFDGVKNPTPFLVAACGGSRLSVLTAGGEPETRALDTSQGAIRISARQAMLSAGICRVPAALIVLLLAASFAAVEAVWQRPFPRLLGDLAVCAALSLGMHAVRMHRSSWTPLALRRRDFGKKLNPTPKETPLGAGRGITIGQLDDLYKFFEHFIGNRNMYYVCSNIVKPLTAPVELSYADLAGPRQLKWFISHFWGMGLRHFVEAVQRHAISASSTSDWRHEAYWICTFSNNQWKVKEELGYGVLEQSSFYLALRSSTCRATLMVVDSDVKPLTRAWCLFEVLQTMELHRARNDFAGLLLGTSSGVLNYGQTGMDVAMALASQLATIDLQNAEASNEDDKAMIRGLVESRPGGFDAVNSFVRQGVCDALATTQDNVQEHFQSLMEKLQASVPDSVLPAHSADRVPDHYLPVFPQGDDPAEDPASPMAKPWEGRQLVGAGAMRLWGRCRWSGAWLLLLAAVAAFGVKLVVELA